MNARELRDLQDSELREQIATLRKELFGLRFANATGELDDTSGIGRAKRNLARALTVARERELDAAELAEPADEPATPADEPATTS